MPHLWPSGLFFSHVFGAILTPSGWSHKGGPTTWLAFFLVGQGKGRCYAPLTGYATSPNMLLHQPYLCCHGRETLVSSRILTRSILLPFPLESPGVSATSCSMVRYGFCPMGSRGWTAGFCCPVCLHPILGVSFSASSTDMAGVVLRLRAPRKRNDDPYRI
ncbi:hypothetical protein LX32DRAFT_81874 [Colletotrichum zoysiae]|uniref:Secreted protein n=1 Tax=Colletotrichum zoysiae TaxID=1216348 RepID=A0AAD9HAN7_9PEZI|nr:hypothetical protein LX32DRAFT_81874 [Colletotrichum zoysiae]